MGIEAIPKLNFSTCHDGWLKEYGRMVSTDIYRKVVKEIIDDTCEVFGNPRYMHLGMDEETMELLNKHGYKMLALTSNWVWKGEMPKPWPTGKDYRTIRRIPRPRSGCIRSPRATSPTKISWA
jgi:hypothetical protein